MEDSWWWWVAVGPLEVVWFLVVSAFVILDRRSAPATVSWILTLTFLPLIGIFVYLVLGPRRYDRRKKRRARAQAAVLERSRAQGRLSDEVGPPQTQLGRMLERTVGSAARPRRGEVTLFTDGKSTYDALEAAIAGAERHVHLEYYIWEPDRIGTRLRDGLVACAARGVEVRVLVDAVGSSKVGRSFWRPLRDAGGQVRHFNALSIMRWRPRMMNFRTHRKIVVVDGVVGFTGGMNVTDVHTSEFSGAEAWRDTHLRIRGAATHGLQTVFFEDWHYAGGDAPELALYLPARDDDSDGERHDDGGDEAGQDIAQVVSSGPDENLDAIHKLFFTAIAGATRRVQLTTPYFVPDETTLNALIVAALGGIDVTLLVPSGGDQPIVTAAARTYYPELLEAGVSIYEHPDPPVLHAKTLVVDDLAVVGTANTDNRSFRLNFEVVVAVHGARLADQLSERLAADLGHSNPVGLDDLRRAGLHRRLFANAARLFSPWL